MGDACQICRAAGTPLCAGGNRLTHGRMRSSTVWDRHQQLQAIRTHAMLPAADRDRAMPGGGSSQFKFKLKLNESPVFFGPILRSNGMIDL
eukprot:SAG31_NODE_6641_length_1942_cov_1.368964_2_plen_91_part_00